MATESECDFDEGIFALMTPFEKWGFDFDEEEEEESE